MTYNETAGYALAKVACRLKAKTFPGVRFIPVLVDGVWKPHGYIQADITHLLER